MEIDKILELFFNPLQYFIFHLSFFCRVYAIYIYIFSTVSFTPSRILHPSIKLECRSKKNNHNDVFHIPLRNFNTFL